MPPPTRPPGKVAFLHPERFVSFPHEQDLLPGIGAAQQMAAPLYEQKADRPLQGAQVAAGPGRLALLRNGPGPRLIGDQGFQGKAVKLLTAV